MQRRTLVLSHNYVRVGTWSRAYETARHCAGRGDAVTMLYPGRATRFWQRSEPDPEAPNLTRVETPCYSHFHNWQEGWGALDWAARMGHALPRRYDLVFVFGHKPNLLLPARWQQWALGATVVADWCDMWGGPEGLIRAAFLKGADFRERRFYQRWARRAAFAIEERLERSFCRRSHGTLAICEWLAERAREYGVPDERILVWPTGCDTERVRVEDAAARRRELELPDGEWLGFICNYHPDSAILLRAFARVVERRPRARLLVAGAAFEGDVTAEHGAAVAERITHLGYQPFERISAILGACDALVLPMANVTMNIARWPHKFTDYLAAGRPIVMNDVGDMPDYARRHDIGPVAAPDADDFARAIIELLESPPERRAQLGANARSLAEGELSRRRQFEKMDAFLANLRR